MPRAWVRVQGSETITTTATLALNQLVYQNSREQSGNITLIQKATVVATHLFAITTTDDTWSVTLLVESEDADAPTYSSPSIAAQGGSDPEIKGHYIFARGPVLYSPRRLISIPTEHTLKMRINKEEGGNTSTFLWHAQFLLNLSL